LYLIQAGTTSTPQNGYQDSGLTIALPNPIPCDAAGRLPQFFLADGLIKVRLVDSDGVQQLVADGIQVIGPSSGGGGGGGSVDPTTIFQTGDSMWQETSGTRTGWVRDNGRTIGSASSGATERANSDCQALFGVLWQRYSDAFCPVSGGRGASAADDWTANKTIKLLDRRLCSPTGLADMGNTALALPAGVPIISGDATTPGSVIGGLTNTLVTGNLPPYTPAGSITNGAISNSVSGGNLGGSIFSAYTSGPFSGPGTTAPISVTSSQAPSVFTGSPQGGTSTPVNNMQQSVLGTFYRKL
jgi:hypothetical protein